MEPTPLEPVDESWERALVVVAHPDDVEFGAAAAIARWTDQGKTVVYCMVTSGEAGIDGMTPDECREIRIGEQIASAKIVGVDEVEFLGLPDGIIEYGVPAAPRDHRGHTQAQSGGHHHQQLPRDLGRNDAQPARSHGGRERRAQRRGRCGQPLDLPEQLVDGLEPWGGVKQVWAAGSPDGQHGVDTTETFDRGVESLMAHKAYIDGLGWENFDPAELLEGMSRPTGSRLGVTHATSFEVFSMTWGDSAPRHELPSRDGLTSRHSSRPARSEVAGNDETAPISAPFRSCSPAWTRTKNPPINSRMLCQLSYGGSAPLAKEHGQLL